MATALSTDLFESDDVVIPHLPILTFGYYVVLGLTAWS
jgi:hypothetical protein